MAAATSEARVVIIGASHAGVQAAQSLRQGGWSGPIVLLSAEDHLPYQRPDLSKGFLVEDRDTPQILKGAPFFDASAIELHLNTRAVSIDRANHRVLTQTGEEIGYDHLILATGAQARSLATKAENIFTLRDLADARAIRTVLKPGKRIAIIGGGFIGFEVAAAARKHGAEVTLFEAGNRCLARALPSAITDYLLDRHAAEGVRVLTGCGIVSPIAEGPLATGLRLADGRTFSCDAIVVGIGCAATADLAKDAGLDMAEGGIAVDARLTTSDPAIMAIGDVAAFSSPQVPGPQRLESIQNATDQARHAASVLLGAETAFSAVPWFWSHQYDIRLQMAGFPQPDAPMLLRGLTAEGSFSLLHLDERQCLVAAYSVNAAPDHMAARKLIGSGIPLDTAKAGDPRIPLLQSQIHAA